MQALGERRSSFSISDNWLTPQFSRVTLTKAAFDRSKYLRYRAPPDEALSRPRKRYRTASGRPVNQIFCMAHLKYPVAQASRRTRRQVARFDGFALLRYACVPGYKWRRHIRRIAEKAAGKMRPDARGSVEQREDSCACRCASAALQLLFCSAQPFSSPSFLRDPLTVEERSSKIDRATPQRWLQCCAGKYSVGTSKLIT